MTMTYADTPPVALRIGDIYNGKMFVGKKNFQSAGHDGGKVHYENIILTEADFRGANLNGAYFDSCIIDGADFTGADILHTRFVGDIDLRKANFGPLILIAQSYNVETRKENISLWTSIWGGYVIKFGDLAFVSDSLDALFKGVRKHSQDIHASYSIIPEYLTMCVNYLEANGKYYEQHYSET